MNNKSIKLYISVIIIITVLVSFNITAFAQDPFTGIAVGGIGGASASGLFGSMAGLSGVNIGYSSDPVNDAMWNSLNPDSVYFSGTKHEATMIDEDVYDYITVDIHDWLDAQHDFIQEFVSQNQVTDNESGVTITSKSYAGYPFNTRINNYTLGGYYLGQCVPNQVINVGSLSLRVNAAGNKCDMYVNGNPYSTGKTVSASWGYFILAVSSGQSNNMYWAMYDGSTYHELGGVSSAVQAESSTNIPYISTTVNTNTFDNWSGAQVKIPHATSGLNPDWTIQEFLDSINDAWTNHTQNTIIIENTDTPPVPPPLPSTPIGELPYDEWVDTWGQTVITNQETGNDSLDNIDTNIQIGVDTLDSIDTNIGTTNGILGQIKDLLTSGLNTITNLLNQILTKVQTLVDSIVNATETLIAGILNQIPIAFQSAWNTLKQSVSIWHYVVEWVTSISNVLTWVWTMASGTSYYIILPVYASLAGAVVLALYKKFGR